jgi:hypothetical protein
VYLCRVRVLYLTYDGLTDPLGQSQILPYIVGLRRRIGEVFAPDIVSFEKTERYAASGEKLREMLSTEGIGWYPQKFHTKPPLLSKAYDEWRFFQVAWKLTRERSYDVYHARSYVAGWVAHRLSARTGRPWFLICGASGRMSGVIMGTGRKTIPFTGGFTAFGKNASTSCCTRPPRSSFLPKPLRKYSFRGVFPPKNHGHPLCS